MATITADYPNIAEAEEAIEAIANAEMVLLRVSIEIEMPDHVDHDGDRYTPTGRDSSYRISQPGNKMTPMPAAEYGYENKRLWLNADGMLLED